MNASFVKDLAESYHMFRESLRYAGTGGVVNRQPSIQDTAQNLREVQKQVGIEVIADDDLKKITTSKGRDSHAYPLLNKLLFNDKRRIARMKSSPPT